MPPTPASPRRWSISGLLKHRGEVEKTEFWFRKAAEGGDTSAVWHLGTLWHYAETEVGTAWIRKAAIGDRPQGCGPARVDYRATCTAIVFGLTSGCSWRCLPTAHRPFAE